MGTSQGGQYGKKGMNGSREIADMMKNYRDNPPLEIDGSPVVALFDYEEQVFKNLQKGSTEKILLPKSNVLQFITEDGSKISARPSGTEPKIKFYFSVNMPLENEAAFEAADKKMDAKIKNIIASMKLE